MAASSASGETPSTGPANAADDDEGTSLNEAFEDDQPDDSEAASTSDDSPAEEHLSKVTVGIHFATNRRGRLRARLLRTRDGHDKTDLSALKEGFPPGEVIVQGRIRAPLNLNALFAEGLFADRSLDEHELRRRAVKSVDRMQREDATPLQDGEPIDTEPIYDLSPDDSDEPPLPDGVRVAIPFITDHGGAVCARLDLDESLRDRTEIATLEDAFEPGKALVRGKIRADVDLEALFSARTVEGSVDPGTMYMPPTSKEE
jgi:hypothetical protein